MECARAVWLARHEALERACAQASKGFYPAVDPLQSSSKLMDRHFLGDRHYAVAEGVRAHLARYRELEDVISMLGLEELSESDRRIVVRARKLQRYPTQPFHVTAACTGMAGAAVPLGATLEDCEAFLSGRFDDLPEDQCYMRGSMRPFHDTSTTHFHMCRPLSQTY